MPGRMDWNLDQSREPFRVAADTAADGSGEPGDLVCCPGSVGPLRVCLRRRMAIAATGTAVVLAPVTTHADREYGATLRESRTASAEEGVRPRGLYGGTPAL